MAVEDYGSKKGILFNFMTPKKCKYKSLERHFVLDPFLRALKHYLWFLKRLEVRITAQAQLYQPRK